MNNDLLIQTQADLHQVIKVAKELARLIKEDDAQNNVYSITDRMSFPTYQWVREHDDKFVSRSEQKRLGILRRGK